MHHMTLTVVIKLGRQASDWFRVCVMGISVEKTGYFESGTKNSKSFKSIILDGQFVIRHTLVLVLLLRGHSCL